MVSIGLFRYPDIGVNGTAIRHEAAFGIMASSGAGLITGHTMHIDGGAYMDG